MSFLHQKPARLLLAASALGLLVIVGAVFATSAFAFSDSLAPSLDGYSKDLIPTGNALRASDPTQPPVLQRFATASSQQNPPAHSSGRSSSNERVMFVLIWALLPRTIRQSLLQIETVANPPGYQPGPKDSTGKWLLQ